jgi:hypothetical protein
LFVCLQFSKSRASLVFDMHGRFMNAMDKLVQSDAANGISRPFHGRFESFDAQMMAAFKAVAQRELPRGMIGRQLSEHELRSMHNHYVSKIAARPRAVPPSPRPLASANSMSAILVARESDRMSAPPPPIKRAQALLERAQIERAQVEHAQVQVERAQVQVEHAQVQVERALAHVALTLALAHVALTLALAHVSLTLAHVALAHVFFFVERECLAERARLKTVDDMSLD